MSDTASVRELRLVVTASDYDEALRFYRDVLGLPERAAYTSPGGRVSVLEAGRATLELADPAHASYIDAVEVGRRVAGHVRVAFEVPDSRAGTIALAGAGAQVLAEPTRTPWNSLNARLSAPAGLQLTLFTEVDDAVARAARVAEAAAGRQGLRVVELHDVDQHREAARLLARVWRTGEARDPMAPDTLRALEHAGNYVTGAYRGDELVGAAVAFRGADHLHSHIAGVDAHSRAAGVGYALKLHQRAWCLARHIPEVRWTFDPLVRRNAYFNLCKLAAVATAYLPDFYGPMTDGINAGDATDRLYVSWLLTSPPVLAAVEGDRPRPPDDTPAGHAVLVDRAADGHPVPGTGVAADGRPVRVAVPVDVEALRQHDRHLAADWRQAVRAALTTALAVGYRITDFSGDGFYLLEK